MTFDYITLKEAARDGIRLGNWKGKAVFAASYNDLENKGSGAYYVLYDDDNTIVARTSQGWKSFGEVAEEGFVHEYGSARNYRSLTEAMEARKTSTSGVRYNSVPVPQVAVKVSEHTAEASYSPGYDRAERPVGDVKTEINVEKTLKMAREMTIEGLLEGFLSGVSFDVVEN